MVNSPDLILFECEIPGRVAIKKNSKKIAFRGGRPRIFSSDNYRIWEADAAPHIVRQKKHFNLPIQGLIEARFEFHFLNHQGEADTSNCIEGPQDLMAKLGVFENDKQIVSLRAVKRFGLPPKTIVKLYQYLCDSEAE